MLLVIGYLGLEWPRQLLQLNVQRAKRWQLHI